MPIRLNGSTSGYSQLDAPAIAGDQLFTLPGAGGTLDRINRAGNVLQVVNATYSTQVVNSTSTFADTGLIATITPATASSKILVLVNQAGCGKNTNNTHLHIKLFRGLTELALIDTGGGFTSSTATSYIGSVSACYLDSPTSTSATTYKTQFASQANNASAVVQVTSSIGTSVSTITLMEIAA